MVGPGTTSGVGRLLHRLVLPVEWTVKRRLFNCRRCGQCLLSNTGKLCPMNCPKGLRNGPCGGTLEGRCEVYPERSCVWVRIHEASNPGQTPHARPLCAPFAEALLNTSSCLNFLSGADRPTRRPLPPRPAQPSGAPAATSSTLAKAFLGGRAVLTSEVRSPRTSAGMKRALSEIRRLAPLVEGLTATSNHGGQPTVPALELAEAIASSGCDGILTLCGRDLDPQRLQDQLEEAWRRGVRTVFCVTGDWPAPPLPAEPSVALSQERFFRMDSAQMIRAVRGLREGRTDLPAGAPEDQPRLYVGGAINPYSRPAWALQTRLRQKLAAGTDFLITQAVCDLNGFRRWAQELRLLERREPGHWRVPVLASIPVVGSAKGLEILRRLPGVYLPEATYRRLAESRDLPGEALFWAEELIETLWSELHLQGFHLMNFGLPLESLARFLERFRLRLGREEGARAKVLQASPGSREVS